MFPVFRSLRARLMVSFIVIIILTVLLAGIPALYLINNELSRQVAARLAQGESATRALYDAQLREMRDLVTLTAERPTLRTLLLTDDHTALVPYLASIQETAGLEVVAVTDDKGRVLIQVPNNRVALPPIENSTGPTAQFEMIAAQVMAMGRAAVVAEDGQILGYVVEGDVIDLAVLEQLRNETGMFHNLYTGDAPLLTTLSATALRRTPTDSSATYYTRAIPLFTTGDRTVFDLIALPTREIAVVRNRFLQVLGISTFLVVALAALLAYLLARRVTAPLKALVKASEALGRGDLATPLPVQAGAIEVSSLSTTLEQMRKRVQAAYQEVEHSKIWHENLVGSLTEGVMTLDQTGKVTSFNKGAEQILGWTPEEVLGRHYDVVFPPATPRHPQHPSPLFTLPGMVTRHTTVTKDKTPLTLKITSGEKTSQAGEQWEQAYVFRNVTEEEQAGRVREFLLANVSHEFKTPLAALHAAAELLATERDDLSTEETQQLVDSIWQGTTRLEEMVDNLLSSASLHTGYFSVRLRPGDLEEIIDEVVIATRPLLQLRGQWLEIDTPSPLRPVQADARRLHQVFVNLISNASKYGPAHAPITVRVEEGIDNSTIRVHDEGRGISADLRPYLFQPFAHQSTPDQTGIGLGLSIVQAIVERHGGRVGVEDGKGEGATFWFTVRTA